MPRGKIPDGLHTFTSEEVLELRRKSGLSQPEFWNRFGVTQSGGCRYETGRDIPPPVQVLLNIAFGNPKTCDMTVRGLRREDVATTP